MNPDDLAKLKAILPVSPGVERINTDNAGPVQREPEKNEGGSKRRAKVHPGRTGEAPELERRGIGAGVDAPQIQEGLGQRILVRVTAFRHKLLDEDNMCEKYHVDLCRYAGVIPDDAPGKTKIEVGQQKVEEGAPEFVRIEIF